MSRSLVSRVERDAVVQRVAGRDEHRVGDEQRQARDPVAPVPHRHALDPHCVEDGDARQQQELDQRQVGAEQARDAPEARQQRGEVVDLAGLLTSLGRVTGMVGALLALVQLLLLARIPVLDEMRSTASTAGTGGTGSPASCCSSRTRSSSPRATRSPTASGSAGRSRDLFGNYSGVLIATIGLALLVAVAITSGGGGPPAARPQAWHAIHVTAYLGVALGFSHQLATGHEFQRQPVARAYWWALYAAALLAIVALRLVVPFVRARDPPPARERVFPGRGASSRSRSAAGASTVWAGPGSRSTGASWRAGTGPRAPAVAVGRAGRSRAAAHRARDYTRRLASLPAGRA